MDMTDLDRVLTAARDRSRVERACANRDWLVYGAGRTGKKWAAALADSGRRVHGFIDRSVTEANGIPVFTLDACPDPLKRSSAVLLGLHNPGVDVSAVRRQLLEAGYREVWLLQDVVDAWPALAHFWLAPAIESLAYTADIEAAYKALADDESRRLVVALLDQRLNGEPDALPPPETDTHYLPHGLPRPSSPMRYVDCGAYTGDTIQSFLRNGLAFEELAAFEPDPAHYPRLARTIESLPAVAFPCGVWDGMTQLRFSSDDSASHIDDTGDIIVQTVALDDALPNFAPTLIKMDIEGAEDRALLGARKTIEAHRPQLAISTYHKPRDLWELMLLVHGWDLGYRFHLRTHCHNGFETVLYGYPS
ncbi:MAG TPA: FkbM family methyltransferase [Thermomonas sp.]|nr:FkbM family methyltransferase [Thermomonas sp.]